KNGRKVECNEVRDKLKEAGVRKHAIVTHIGFSYRRRNVRVAVRCCRNGFPQRFPPASRYWKLVCCIYAHPGRKRSVPGLHETRDTEWHDGRFNVLSGDNSMV